MQNNPNFLFNPNKKNKSSNIFSYCKMQFLCQIGKFLRLKSRTCGLISSTQRVCMMAVLVSTTETPAMLLCLHIQNRCPGHYSWCDMINLFTCTLTPTLINMCIKPAYSSVAQRRSLTNSLSWKLKYTYPMCKHCVVPSGKDF